jgi:hypothetical protein
MLTISEQFKHSVVLTVDCWLLAVGGTTLNRKTDINDGATGIDLIHLR